MRSPSRCTARSFLFPRIAGIAWIALAASFGWVVLAAPTLAVPPTAPARAVAEWEPAHGTLIRWPLGIPWTLVRELAEDDSVYVLCETQSAENAARSGFQANGVNLAHGRFLRIGTYSHWTRDWGPHGVFDGSGQLGITDPYFNGYPWVPPTVGPGNPPGDAPVSFAATAGARGYHPNSGRDGGNASRRAAAGDARDGADGGPRGYEEDDLVNPQLAALLGVPVWSMPAYCTGGNFMTDGHGIAFSTTQMVNENLPLMTEAQFRAYATQYLGISDYTFLHGTEANGIQHIDCWAKLLDEETVLVKTVPSWHEEYPRIEQNVQILAGLTNCYGRPYRIVRIDTPPYNGYDVAAYTNSLILNRKVLVPTFGISGDAAALQVYRDAMPGYEVIGFVGSWYYYDALHCRTMAIFDEGMLRIWHRRLDEEMPPASAYPVTAMIDDRSEAGLDSSALLLRWRRQGEPAWNDEPLVATAGPDSFAAAIPGALAGTGIEYYLTAADLSGRVETLPRTAPDGFYSFVVTADPAGVGDRDGAVILSEDRRTMLRVWPNPSREGMTILLSGGEARPAPPLGALGVRIVDPMGRTVREMAVTAPAANASGELRLSWDGRDAAGRLCPAGVYWIFAQTAGEERTARVIVVR